MPSPVRAIHPRYAHRVKNEAFTRGLDDPTRPLRPALSRTTNLRSERRIEEKPKALAAGLTPTREMRTRAIETIFSVKAGDPATVYSNDLPDATIKLP